MSKSEHAWGIFSILSVIGCIVCIFVFNYHVGFIGGPIVASLYAMRYLNRLHLYRHGYGYLPGPFYDPDILDEDDDEEEETEEASPAPGKR